MNDASNIFELYLESNQQATMHHDWEGNKRWMLNGVPHREDGPAIEFQNGTKSWYLHGKRHRTNGPAIENSLGIRNPAAWRVDGVQYRSIDAWAKAALEYEGKKVTQDAVDDKVAAVMRADVFS